MTPAEAGDADTVRQLLADGVDPNARDILGGYTALHIASGRGYIEIVKLLVQAGANIADTKNTVYLSPLGSGSASRIVPRSFPSSSTAALTRASNTGTARFPYYGKLKAMGRLLLQTYYGVLRCLGGRAAK